ncbi:MAG: glycolate oxidase subunit GlcF [Gammaproteobacteria bacterium]|nr:glycolate oxidase subunit GlcF [Gammaproteobacteria bacterium]
MQTNLADFIRDTPRGQRADAILRSCVHCGFCNATCPTYQLLGDELDGPRGRIYLIKQLLEGEAATTVTQLHLDRCLTCRNCETTCPSGVRYGELVDIGRAVVHGQVGRSLGERVARATMRTVLTSPSLFAAIFSVGHAFKWLLPERLSRQFKLPEPAGPWPSEQPGSSHRRRMAVLGGCVQPVLGPRINAAAARVLHRLGITLELRAGSACCGAVDHHMDAADAAKTHARANVDAWCKALDEGLEAIVMTASGCGTMVKEYPQLLADDPRYQAKARRVSDHTFDLAEIMAKEAIETLPLTGLEQACWSYHPPCSLQHAQQLPGVVEGILRRLDVTLTANAETHLCCGSAGTYSLLQPALSEQLRERKLNHLERGGPTHILTANIGCMHHLQSGTERPVMHWIEALDQALRPAQEDCQEPADQ